MRMNGNSMDCTETVLVFPTTGIGETGTRAGGDLTLTICERCRTASWDRFGQPLDPAIGVELVFGDFEIVSEIDAVGAPAPRVLVASPAPKSRAPTLASGQLPVGVWIEMMDNLWISHRDGVLLLAIEAGLAPVGGSRDSWVG